MTDVYKIDEVTFFGDTDQISSFHYKMFHGEAERPGTRKHTPEWYGHGEGSKCPLSIVRPGNAIPPIFVPQIGLVVNEEIAESLRNFSGFGLLAVNFERLIDMECRKGDMSWYCTEQAPLDPSLYLRSAPDNRKKFEPVPTHFEVLAPRLQDIRDSFDNCQKYLPTAFEPVDEEPFYTSDEMLHQFPIVWHYGTYVTRDVLRVLGPQLDRDFFSVREVLPAEE